MNYNKVDLLVQMKNKMDKCIIIIKGLREVFSMVNTEGKGIFSLNYIKSIEELGEIYQQSIPSDIKKSLGKYYTPSYIVDFILENTLRKANVLEKPFLKILDPACGSGYFLVKAYDILKEKFLLVLPELKERYSDEVYKVYDDGKYREIKGSEYWEESNLHCHILRHCIFGADVDKNALWFCSAALLAKSEVKYKENLNIIYCDSLVRWEKKYDVKEIEEELAEYRLIYGINDYEEDRIHYYDRKTAEKVLKKSRFWSNKFDYIVGNPPYIGHKSLSLDYKAWLLKEYKEVFRDKSDLSYCFYLRALEVAQNDGIIAFISSRYFMESPTGESLRKYLKENSKIIKIIDFCDGKVFKNLGIATMIIIISSSLEENTLEVWKYEGEDIDRIDPEEFKIFEIEQKSLYSDRWILIPNEKRRILNNIEDSCANRLGDIVKSFQGIITGCDKAFVMNRSLAEELSIEKELLKPWIKNSHIERYKVKSSNLRLIYSNWIDNKDNYPRSISHIEKYKRRLENRRETRKGIRPWYHLQWGRNPELFMQDKIVYPFKGKNNRFAIDNFHNFCSADVYSFIIKEETKGYTLPFLLGVLNSGLYEFYFQLFAKKMGGGIYDYYPNTVMDLKIPDYDDCKDIESISIEILELCGEEGREKEISILENKIDYMLKDYFQL